MDPSNWSWSDVSRATEMLRTPALDPQAVRSAISPKHTATRAAQG